MAGFQVFLAVVDGVAKVTPHPLPEISPTQLVDQLGAVIPALVALPKLTEHRIAHFRQGEDAVADPGGETCDGAIQVVAAASVTSGIKALKLPCCGCTSAADRTEASRRGRKELAQSLIEGLAIHKIPRQILRLR